MLSHCIHILHFFNSFFFLYFCNNLLCWHVLIAHFWSKERAIKHAENWSKVKCERDRRATTLKTRRRLKRRRMEFVLCRFYRTLQIHLYLDTHDTLPLLRAARQLFSWPCKQQLLSKEKKEREKQKAGSLFIIDYSVLTIC